MRTTFNFLFCAVGLAFLFSNVVHADIYLPGGNCFQGYFCDDGVKYLTWDCVDPVTGIRHGFILNTMESCVSSVKAE
jgi:hypothetical protein